MAVVFRNSNITTNADGLNIAYGTAEALVGRTGAYSTGVAGEHVVTAIIDLATLNTSDEQIQSPTVKIPGGVQITKVVVTVVEEPTTSGSPDLDVGLVKQDLTELDFNGLLAAADAFETGTDLGRVVEYTLGTTEAGALVGAYTTEEGYISAGAVTAVWTDGTVKVDIYYLVPVSADL